MKAISMRINLKEACEMSVLGQKHNLKTFITEDDFVVRIEITHRTANTSFPLLTLTYNKYTKQFVLAIERRFVTQKSTLQALTEALEKVKEVIMYEGKTKDSGK